jgi:hypothetical protein
MSQATFFQMPTCARRSPARAAVRAAGRQGDRRAQAPGGNGKRARSMSGLMSGSTLYDTVLLLSIVAAIVAGVWLLWRI